MSKLSDYDVFLIQVQNFTWGELLLHLDAVYGRPTRWPDMTMGELKRELARQLAHENKREPAVH